MRIALTRSFISILRELADSFRKPSTGQAARLRLPAHVENAV
jgi:hypothetical protein